MQEIKPIRVLHVFGKLNTGGAETMIMNIYRKIDKEKIQFDFLIHTHEECDFTNEILKLGGKIYSVRRFRGYNIIGYVKDFYLFFKIHPEYKIVHGHVRSTAAIYLAIAKTFKYITISHSHSTSSGRGISAIVKNILQFPIRYIADYFFSCSIEAGKWLFGKKAIKSNKFFLIKNSINLDNYIYSINQRKELRKQFDLNDDDFVLGYLGRVVEAKNPFFVVEVFKELVDLYPKTKLLFVGDGVLLDKVKEKVKGYGLTDKAIFTGTINQTSPVYEIMDYYIFPSLWEGLGMSLIEAQASGLKCICSEYIPSDAIITNLVKKVSLKIGEKKWAQIILNDFQYERKSPTQKIKSAGYDIQDNIAFIQNFYMTCLDK